MLIPTRLELLGALKKGSKDDLALITQYIEHKECNMMLLVHAAFREGCFMAVAHILKQNSVKDYLRQISDDKRLVSILQTSIDCGKRRLICELAAAIPTLPRCLLFNLNIKKVLDSKPKFLWHRQLAAGLKKNLPSEAVGIIFNFLLNNDTLISQDKILEITTTSQPRSYAKCTVFTTV